MTTRARGRVGWALIAVGTFALIAVGCLDDVGGIHARMAWSEEGMRVVDVPEGPAALAGLQPGDRIVAIDGAPVSTLTMGDAVERLRGKVGSKVTLEVLRAHRVLTLHIARAPYDR